METNQTTEAFADLIGTLKDEHAHIAQQLTSQAQGIIRRMEQLIKSVEAGLSVNNLGELQSSGPALDILCARYVESAQTVTRVEYFAKRAAGA